MTYLQLTLFVFAKEYIATIHVLLFYMWQNLCEDKLIDDVEYSASTKNLLVRSKDDLTR